MICHSERLAGAKKKKEKKKKTRRDKKRMKNDEAVPNLEVECR